MKPPKVSVILPTYNRDHELLRALRSVQNQDYRYWECIIVDDCSTKSLPDLSEFLQDPRFVLLKNSINGGPYNARILGYKNVTGDIVVHLDSDWAFFPWSLSRIVFHFSNDESLMGVSGLHFHEERSRCFVRVAAGRKLVKPSEYLELGPVPDSVGAVRTKIINEWLTLSKDYFSFEFHQWFSYGHKHAMLYVDEPWCRYFDGSATRVSNSASQRKRHIADVCLFVKDQPKEIDSSPMKFLDDLLLDATITALRLRQWNIARSFFSTLKRRGRINVSIALLKVVGRKLIWGQIWRDHNDDKPFFVN